VREALEKAGLAIAHSEVTRIPENTVAVSGHAAEQVLKLMEDLEDHDDVQGVAITMQGKRDQDLLRIDPRHDGRGNPYYWLTFARKERPKPRDGTDLSAVAAKRISVTALRLDLTDEPFMTRLASVFRA